jgi:hypothetical protein
MKLKRRQEEILEHDQKMSLLLLNTLFALDVLQLKHYRCEGSYNTTLYQFLGNENTSNICVTLVIWKGNVFVTTLHL